jgi:glycine cleavage system H protein
VADEAPTDSLTFLMGKFPAQLPKDREYCRNHMWRQAAGERHRFGFTAYAVRLMQDVYFLDWSVNPGDELQQLQAIGHIETSKATADLFAPVAGKLLAFNNELLADPAHINVDNYGAGWLFEMSGPAHGTLSPEEYYQFLEQNWEKTQRMLKGHM